MEKVPLHWHLGTTQLLTGYYRMGYWRGPEDCPPTCPGIEPPYTRSQAIPVNDPTEPGSVPVGIRRLALSTALRADDATVRAAGYSLDALAQCELLETELQDFANRVGQADAPPAPAVDCSGGRTAGRPGLWCPPRRLIGNLRGTTEP